MFDRDDTPEIKKIVKEPLDILYWFKCPYLEKSHHSICKESIKVLLKAFQWFLKNLGKEVSAEK